MTATINKFAETTLNSLNAIVIILRMKRTFDFSPKFSLTGLWLIFFLTPRYSLCFLSLLGHFSLNSTEHLLMQYVTAIFKKLKHQLIFRSYLKGRGWLSRAKAQVIPCMATF